MVVTAEMLTHRGKIPRSVIRDAFYLFMETADNKIKQIKRVKNLRYTGPLKDFLSYGHTEQEFHREIFGMLDDAVISINAICKKSEAIKTLLHELAHFLYDTDDSIKSEWQANEIERILWRRFSRKQKEAFWALIPKE